LVKSWRDQAAKIRFESLKETSLLSYLKRHDQICDFFVNSQS